MTTSINVFYFLTVSYYCLSSSTVRASKDSKAKLDRECVVSEEDLVDVLRSDCFVDKSLLAKEFLTMGPRFVLVTAPRRFGKSVNLKMLKAFLTNEDEGRSGLCSGIHRWVCRLFRKEPSLTPGCRLFKHNDLNIYRFNESQFFNSHCGQYPVIYASFKSVTGDSFSGILTHFRGIVHRAFLEHKYLRYSKLLDDDEKKTVSLYAGRLIHDDLTETQVVLGLRFLSEMLHKHFNKKVIFLIDDFDAPVWDIIERDFPLMDVRKTIKFIRTFTSTTLKANEYIDRALISACVRLSAIFSSDANNIFHLRFLGRHPLVKYYGLTSMEVKKLLGKFDIRDNYIDVKDYYDGYNTPSRLKMYSTWSIINYMQNEELKDYSTDLDSLMRFFQEGTVRKLIIQLLETGFIKIENTEKASHDEIGLLMIKELMETHVTFKMSLAERFVQFLTDHGYFIARSSYTSKVTITVPNEEIHQRLFSAITHKLYFENYFKFKTRRVNEFVDALNCIGMDDNSTASLVRFRDSVVDLFRNNRIPDSEGAFQGYLYTIIESSEIFSHTKMEVTGNFRKDPFDGSLYLSQVGGECPYFKNEKVVVRIRADVLTVRKADGTGVIIETRRNRESAEEALHQIVNATAPYYSLFDLDDYRSNVNEGRIYIGLHLNTTDNNVTACYLINNTYMNSTICV